MADVLPLLLEIVRHGHIESPTNNVTELLATKGL